MTYPFMQMEEVSQHNYGFFCKFPEWFNVSNNKLILCFMCVENNFNPRDGW